MMTTPIILANRKMNKSFVEVQDFCKQLKIFVEKSKTEQQIMIAPPAIYLQWCNNYFSEIPQVSIVAQQCSEHSLGAYTGEVHASMLSSIGVERVIIGHSERRLHHDENGIIIKQQLQSAIDAGLNIIYCCGESLDIREQGTYKEYIQQQLEKELLPCINNTSANICIAYEPIRSISTSGTGIVPTQEIIEEITQYITSETASYGDMPTLYGGSVTAKNASELISYDGVRGFLIGGASLGIESFCKITLS